MASDPAQLPPTPLICGPTAGGKSDLAVDLALALREEHNITAEIVTADAFQVYRGLDIGTAKPTICERRGVPHHLIDVIESSPRGEVPRSAAAEGVLPKPETRNPKPDSPFTLDSWLTLAHQTIQQLRGQNVLPIVVGGTHLYIKALLEGLFQGPEPDHALRAELAAMDPQARRAELERVDPVAALRIHPNDLRRTTRALEVFRQTGKPISTHQSQWDKRIADSTSDLVASNPKSEIRNPRFQLVVLDWPSELLNPRINARVKKMFDDGLLDEVRALVERDAFTPQSAEALGYKQLIPLAERALAANTWPPPAADLEPAIEKIKIETRRFAKNQRTWLRRLSTTPGSLRLPAATLPRDQWVVHILAALTHPRPG